MSVALYFTDVTNAISNLTISGVKIVDYNGVANSWVTQPNVLYLNPENAVVFEPPEFLTNLRGASAPMNASYTLNYRFLGTQLGDAGDVTGYPDMLDKIIPVFNKLAETDAPYSGKIHMEVGRIATGARADPSGNAFFGADIELRVTEIQN